jgi:SAM-dependent methyltransferase
MNPTLDINTIETLGAMECAPNYHNWLLDEFKPYFGKNIVEVGSGTGSITKKLLENNIEKLFSIEPSEMVYQQLTLSVNSYLQEINSPVSFHGINTFLVDAVPKLKNEKIDTFIYINVLEHVEKDEEELEHIYSILENGGKLLIFVPALQWLYGTHDLNVGHFRRYYKKDLQKKVEQAGFKILKNNYFDFLGILPWWIAFRVLKIKYLKDGQSKIYDRFIVPIERKFESKFAPFVGKNLLLVAEKIL